MVAWPAALQQKHLSGLTEKRQPGVVRSTMDQWRPKRRKRITAVIREISVPVAFSIAEKNTFDTFFITTLGEGSLPFDWTDPKDGTTTVSYLFKEPPSFTKSGGLWRATLNLEVLP